MDVNRKELLAILDLMAKIKPRTDIPVLSYIRMIPDTTRLNLTYSNGEVEVRGSISYQDSPLFSSCMTQFQILRRVIRKMMCDEISLSCSDNILRVSSPTTNIYLPVFTVSSFCEISPGELSPRCMPNVLEMQRILYQAKSYVAKDDLRPVINGIYFFCDSGRGRRGACATDAHRLYLSEEKWAGSSWSFNLPLQAVPAIEALLRKRTEYNVCSNDKYVKFSSGHGEVLIRTVDGPYVNLMAVIPNTDNDYSRYVVNRQELLSAISLISETANNSTGMAILSIDGDSIKVSSKDANFGISGDVTIPVGLQLGVGARKIGVKAIFAEQILCGINTQDVILYVSEITRCIVIEPESNMGYKAILMPMMITD